MSIKRTLAFALALVMCFSLVTPGVAFADESTHTHTPKGESVVTAPTCTEQGYTTYTCSECGESYKADETAALNHDFSVFVETVAATAEAEGYTLYQCSRCEETEKRDFTSYVAPTQDETPAETAVASVNGVEYADIAEAVEAALAGEGSVLVLLADIKSEIVLQPGDSLSVRADEFEITVKAADGCELTMSEADENGVVVYTASEAPAIRLLEADNTPLDDTQEEPQLPEAEITPYEGNVLLFAASQLGINVEKMPVSHSYTVWGGNIGTVTLNKVWDFAPKDTLDEAQESYYSDWKCDYTVSFDKPVAANSVGLYGAYYNDTNLRFGFLLDQDIPKDTRYYLLKTAGFGDAFDYQNIVGTVGEFLCSAFSTSHENDNTNITVQLVLYNDVEVKVVNSTTVSLGDLFSLLTVDETAYEHHSSGFHANAMAVENGSLVSTTTAGPHFAPVNATAYVAQIGSTKYATLADAIAAANSDDTVLMLQDITLDATLELSKSFTLDLGGHTLSKSASPSDKTPVIKALSGNVMIQNGSITYDISTYTGTGGQSYANVINVGMNMSNGVYSGGDCTLTLNGVNVSDTFPKGKSLSAIYVESGTLNVVGSRISATNVSGNTSAQHLIYTTAHASAKVNPRVTISGNSTLNTNSSAGIHAIWLQGSYDTLMIFGNGVTINAEATWKPNSYTTSYAYAVNNQSGATCTIEGGSFTGKVWQTKGAITVSGGLYSYAQGTSGLKNKVTLAEGYEYVENTDPDTKDQYPYVVVQERSGVAEIVNGDSFNSVEEAIAADTNDQQINITGNTEFAGVALTDGDTITVANTSDAITGSSASAKEVTISHDSTTTTAYVVSNGTNTGVITSVTKDDTVTAENKSAVSDFIDVADVLAGAVAANSTLDPSAITSMKLSLSNQAEDSSSNEAVQAVITAGGKAFEVHPVATITKTVGSDTSTISYEVKNSELASGASFTFSLDLGEDFANKTVILTHYGTNDTVVLGAFPADENGTVSGVSLSSFSIVTAAEAVASYKASSDGELIYVDDLTDAINGVYSGGTVTLLKDVNLGNASLSISKALTLTSKEGQTYGITSSVDAGKAAIVVVGSGDVTIDKVNVTSTKGHGIQTGNDSAAYSGKLSFKNATLTVVQRGIRVSKIGTGFGIDLDNAIVENSKKTSSYETTYNSDSINSLGLSLANVQGTPVQYKVNISNNSEIRGFAYCINGTSSGSNITVEMIGGKLYGRAGVNFWGNNNTITLNGVEVNGLNNQTGSTEGFACIVDNSPATGNTYNIIGCTFNAKLSSAAASTSGSSASEEMIDLRGTGSKAYIEGSTTYTAYVGGETVAPGSDGYERFGLMTNYGALSNNNTVDLSKDAKTSLSAVLDAMDEDVDQDNSTWYTDQGITLGYTPEVHYYWDGGGVYCDFEDVFITSFYAIGDGEVVDLQKDVTLTKNSTCTMYGGAVGTLIMNLGTNEVTKGEYSVTLAVGTSVKTDKRVDFFSAPEGYKLVETDNGDNTYTYTAAKVVAQIGDVKYTSLADAFAAANEATAATTITVLADTTVSETITLNPTKSVTLDLAGHTVTTTLAGLTPAFKLTKGTLTVKDSGVTTGGITGTGMIFRIDSRESGVTSASGATLNINSTANVTSSGSPCVFVRGYATVNTSGNLTSSGDYATIQGNGSDTAYKTAITVSGGSVISNDSNAIYHPQPGTLKVTGGTVQGSSSGIAIKAGTLTVSGGSIKATGPADIPTSGWSNGVEASGCAIQIESNKDYDTNGVTVNISNGTVESTNGAAVYEYIGGGEGTKLTQLKVTGGTFKAASDKNAVILSQQAADAKAAAISGGSFSSVVPEAYCADGYEPVTTKDSNGMYTVQVAADSGVASITRDDVKTYYLTVTAALSAAQDGETVVMEKDYSYSGGSASAQLAAQKSITLDLNGHTLEHTNGKNALYVSGSSGKVPNLTVTGTGTVKSNATAIKAGATAVVTLGPDVTVIGNRGVEIGGGNTTFTSKATITGTEAGILVAGAGTSNANKIVNIEGGSVSGEYGIYSNQAATVNVSAGTVSGTIAAIALNGYQAYGENGNDYTIKLNVTGGEVKGTGEGSAIAASGNKNDGNYEMNLSGGKISSDDNAIYHCNDGVVNVSGTVSITGATGIYQKSGTLNVSGGTINGNGAAAAYMPGSSGANPTGDAIVIDNCGYPGGAPNAYIKGAKLSTSGKQVGYYVNNNDSLEGDVFADNEYSLNTNVQKGWVDYSSAEGYSYKIGEAPVAELEILQTLNLASQIDITLYIKKDPSITDYSITYTRGTQSVSKKLSETDTVNGYYKIVIGSFDAKQMTETVYVVISNGYDTQVYANDYSIKKYCDSVIDGNYADKLKNLCKATLDYGTYSQKYFNYNLENLANGGTDYFTLNTVNDSFAGVNGSLDGVNALMSLNLQSQVQLIFYFAPYVTIESVTARNSGFTGWNYTTSELSSGYTKVAISGIPSGKLNEVFDITVSNGTASSTWSWSAMSFANASQGNSTMSGVCKALANYYNYASAYFPNT